jgi:hypothetical protein
MSKSKISSGVRDQFTAANRIVTILSKFDAKQRARIQEIVSEHVYDAAPVVDDKTADLPFEDGLPV